MNNLETNLTILKYLEDYIRKHPEIRFNQALLSLNIVPITSLTENYLYYEESKLTLESLKKMYSLSKAIS